MFFSIIIPVKKINKYIYNNIKIINQCNYKKLEIIILPDIKFNKKIISDIKTKIIATGKIRPGLKRDIGAKYAKGDYLIFLDDDSYPSKNYFINLKTIIKKTKYKVLGGPAQTPQSNSYLQKVSGSVFLSKFSGGNPDRYIPGKIERFYDDWPSVNLVVEKKIFKKIGGYGNNYWPGEDTYFCNKLLRRKIKIFYSPKLLVWHHRREGLGRHLIQVGAYGLHRGFFAKKYPENSCKIKYFFPSIFILFFCSIIVISLVFDLKFFYLFTPYIFILFLSLIEILKYENLKIASLSLIYIFLTHLYYGYKFLIGLGKKQL